MNNTILNFVSATEVRKEWSVYFDKAIRERPIFIKRTRDNAVLSDVNFINELLSGYRYECAKHLEEDGTVTLSMELMDIAENADTEERAKSKIAQSILDYAGDFYSEYEMWSKSPNRKKHIPYVFKALLLNDSSKIEGFISVQ